MTSIVGWDLSSYMPCLLFFPFYSYPLAINIVVVKFLRTFEGFSMALKEKEEADHEKEKETHQHNSSSTNTIAQAYQHKTNSYCLGRLRLASSTHHPLVYSYETFYTPPFCILIPLSNSPPPNLFPTCSENMLCIFLQPDLAGPFFLGVMNSP